MGHEEIQLEVDIQKMEHTLEHHTLSGQFKKLHDALEDLIDAVQDSFPQIL